MRTVPAAITAARASNASRLCKIWRLERADGVVLRFTEHDRALEVDGETYLATASFDPSTIAHSADLSVGDLDVHGAFDSAYITAEDVIAGRYSGAAFLVAEVLWDNTAAGMDVLKVGWLGTIREVGGKFVAELLDLNARLQQTIGELYSASCRATLGDARCKVNLAAFTIGDDESNAPVVDAVTSRRIFTAHYLSAQAAGYWTGGLLTWLSGANAGLAMEVLDCDDTTITLALSMPFDVQAGDTFRMVAGCDHARTTCRDKFANVHNFRGEPDVPVNDDLIRGPGPDSARAPGAPAGDVTPPAVPDPETPTLRGSPSMSA